MTLGSGSGRTAFFRPARCAAPSRTTTATASPTQVSSVHRPRIPFVAVLGFGIVLAGMGALAREVPPPGASLCRTVDDQRHSVAQLEVRDGAEEQDEQEDKSGTTSGPALADVAAGRAVEPWTFFAIPAARVDASRPHGRARFIRGPPRCG